MTVDAIRSRLEAMHAELGREYYETRAGLRSESRLAAILDRHRDLASPEALAAVEARRAAAAGDPEEERRLRLLAEAIAGNVEDFRLREVGDRLNDLEASLAMDVDGEKVPYRELPGRIRRTADRERRRAAHRALVAAMAGPLRPLHRERIRIARQVAADLGHADYADFVARTSGIDLEGLGKAVNPILERTTARLTELLSAALRRATGLPLAAAESHDIVAVFRAPQLDAVFPAGGEVDLARATVERGLGLDLTASGRIHLDLEPRPAKSPRAFCASVRVPEEVYLVTKPAGGVADYGSFFHELGHALHFAHTDPEHPVEYRRLGDNSVTEGYAVLMDGILRERAWAERHLGRDLEAYLAHAVLHDLWVYRRYAAKLAYELELWRAPAAAMAGEDDDALAGRYAAHLGAVAPVPVDRERHLADLDLHFYAARYLRAWLLAAILRSHLRADFGDAWFDSRRAGRFLRELWSYGQKLDAVEIARELGEDGLTADPLLEEVDELAT